MTVRAAPATADLTAPAATGFGINAGIHATLDYRTPRRWAEALWRRGWRALRHVSRGDVSGRQAGRALFGRAGLHTRAARRHVHDGPAAGPELAEQLLADRRVEVRPIPLHVPVEPLPRS